MRKSIFCVLLSVVLLTGVFSPAALAEQADAAQITDDMTDWSIAAYHSENWERFLSQPESGLGVIGAQYSCVLYSHSRCLAIPITISD